MRNKSVKTFMTTTIVEQNRSHQHPKQKQYRTCHKFLVNYIPLRIVLTDSDSVGGDETGTHVTDKQTEAAALFSTRYFVHYQWKAVAALLSLITDY